MRKSASSRLVGTLAAVATGFLMSVAPAVKAQDAAAYYKGKTVKFVVGFGTGGG